MYDVRYSPRLPSVQKRTKAVYPLPLLPQHIYTHTKTTLVQVMQHRIKVQEQVSHTGILSINTIH